MKLIFVYNANSSFFDRVLDNAHKIISPSSYDCNLCAITFGNFKEDDLWKTYRENSNQEMIFLHKDDFLKQYKSKWLPKYDFPIVLSQTDDLEIFLSSERLNTFNSAEELIEEITRLTQ
jgi:hypothetical protein